MPLKKRPKRLGSITTIQPLHYSYAALLRKGVRIKPYNMERLHGLSQETSDGLTQIAIDIFVDCTNAGVPFQDSLAALYLSGLQHGQAIVSGSE